EGRVEVLDLVAAVDLVVEDELVLALAAGHVIGADTAEDGVVAVVAEELVAAGLAPDLVVAEEAAQRVVVGRTVDAVIAVEERLDVRKLLHLVGTQGEVGDHVLIVILVEGVEEDAHAIENAVVLDVVANTL